jgi:uncharacterized protein YjlB
METPLHAAEVRHYLIRELGNFPNNSRLPVIIYHSGLDLPDREHAAAGTIEDIFRSNNWKNAWRNGIYDYHHYHSNTHECLGVYDGNAIVQLGGPQAEVKIKLNRGDVIVIPAGVAHKRLQCSDDFKCVGAYPDGVDYNMRYGRMDERPQADREILSVPVPLFDPLYGLNGMLFGYWKS